jgi:hypothetical protein
MKLKLAVLTALTIPCYAAITISLPGNSESALWTGLGNVKYPSSAGYNTFGTNSGPFNSNPALALLAPDAGSTLGGTFTKASGGGYFASTSIYNFGVPGTLIVADTAALASLKTVVFQLDLGAPLAGAPTLSYNGGSQNLTPNNQTTSTGLFLSGFSGPPSPTTNYAWQWDLSAAGATSYAITFTTIPHGSIYRIDLAAGDTFAQVIPEPSSALLGGTALALTFFRRRRG